METQYRQLRHHEMLAQCRAIVQQFWCSMQPENIISSLIRHLQHDHLWFTIVSNTSSRMVGQEMDEARKDAVEKALAAKDAAEAQMREERALRDRMLQAAAAGQLPGQAPEAEEGGPETPGGAQDPPATPPPPPRPACGIPVLIDCASSH